MQTQACLLSVSHAYQHSLYQISPINKTLNKAILSMAYTPGVGRVCTEINKNPSLVDELTLRGRAVAIVSQGNCIQSRSIAPGKMPPIMDWCVVQLKYYAGVDAFPFIIRHGANTTTVLSDLANSYAAILLLDPQYGYEIGALPSDVAILRQADVSKATGKKDVLDCEDTARVLGYVLENRVRGVVGEGEIGKGLEFRPATFRKQSSYFMKYRDGRDNGEKSLDMHRKFEGKIHIELNFDNICQLKKCFSTDNLLQFALNRQRSNGYQKISAIVTDGTAILGLGDIGPRAGLPVMQGKSLLFKVLGGVNVVPICINKRKTDQQAIEAILDIASYFKAINLQDIKSPNCFFIQRGLQSRKILPVFHDDQHGTAIVTLAALINALKVAGKKIQEVKIVMTGVGAAGISICKLFLKHGAKNIIMADTKGAIYEGRKQGMNKEKEELAKITNRQKIQGKVQDIIKGADVFVGVSGPKTLTTEDVKNMAPKSIVFALANPDPQISLLDAQAGGVFIYGSGRSDFKNQINNSLVFPGIFRAIHEHDLPLITDEMEQAVAVLIAQNIDRPPTQKHIIVDSLDLDMPLIVSQGLSKFKNQGKGAQQGAKL